MINHYQIKDRRLVKGTISNGLQVITLDRPTENEVKRLCQQFDLDPITFRYCNSPEEVSRFNGLNSRVLNQPHVLVYYDFIADHPKIEEQLAPVIIVFDDWHLIICSEQVDNWLTKLVIPDERVVGIILQLLQVGEQHLMVALRKYKPVIDRLDAAARRTIENQELRQLTDLTRCLVYFEHTMNDQKTTLEAFLATSLVSEFDDQLILDIQTQQRRLAKMIHVYRDLLESISGLFTAMMDNNLNHLMKYLDSAALVIAIPALISGLYGMNVGGLPWKSSQYGFWLVLGLATVLAIMVAIMLKWKRYS